MKCILGPTKFVIGRNYVYYWILRGYNKGREGAADDTEEGVWPSS